MNGTTFTQGMQVRHLELDIVGVIESGVPVIVNHSNLRRVMLNVKVGEFDGVWWDSAKLEPLQPIVPNMQVV